MRTTAAFFAYLFLCLALAAVVTHPVLQFVSIQYEPQQVMGRIAQLFILLGLWPFLRWMGCANAAALGFGIERSRFLRSVLRGWFVGVLVLLVLMAALLLLRVRVPDPPPGGLLGPVLEKAVSALIGGLLIALLEETFFRGALFGVVRGRDGLRSAAIWSAALYAIVHFLKPHALPPGVLFDWDGALAMFVHAFTGVLQWRHLDSFAALFSVGLFLALVRERTGHIGWCIGLHAGWVFVIQVSRQLSDGDPAARLAFLAGDYDGVIGWLAAVWIGLLALVYWRWSAPFVAAERNRAPVSGR